MNARLILQKAFAYAEVVERNQDVDNNWNGETQEKFRKLERQVLEIFGEEPMMDYFRYWKSAQNAKSFI